MKNSQPDVNWHKILFAVDNKTDKLPLEVSLGTAFRVYLWRFLAMLLASMPGLIFIGYAGVFFEQSAIISTLMIVLSFITSVMIFTASIRRKSTVIDRIIKRFMDIFISMITFAFLAPFIMVVAVLIKLESPGPVFVKQRRLGKHNEVFWVLKFRTAIMDAEASTLPERGSELHAAESSLYPKTDPRITVIGRILRRTNLAELPQMWNVLKGEMSLIGPRPIPLYLADHLRGEEGYEIRQSLSPGITGLAQVTLFLSPHSDWSKALEFDAYYAEHWNLWMDMQILAKTVIVTFEKQGAY